MLYRLFKYFFIFFFFIFFVCLSKDELLRNVRYGEIYNLLIYQYFFFFSNIKWTWVDGIFCVFRGVRQTFMWFELSERFIDFIRHFYQLYIANLLSWSIYALRNKVDNHFSQFCSYRPIAVNDSYFILFFNISSIYLYLIYFVNKYVYLYTDIEKKKMFNVQVSDDALALDAWITMLCTIRYGCGCVYVSGLCVCHFWYSRVFFYLNS